MGEGIIDQADRAEQASREEKSLDGEGSKQALDFLLWCIGGVLSHIPLIFASFAAYVLNINNYQKIVTDFVGGGELIWVATVFLVLTIFTSITGLFSRPVEKIKLKVFLVCSGGVLCFICFGSYVIIKGMNEPISSIASGFLWILSMTVSVFIWRLSVSSRIYKKGS